jgi:hypothetical protein
MPMTEYDGNVEIITNIGTTPDERGLSTDEFKAKFDEGLKAFVTWFNDTHKTEFDAITTSITNTSNPKNKIINGNFNINQRVVSGTVTLAAGAYGHDRWKAGASGCTYTFATVEGVTTLTITAGSLQQVIEGSAFKTGTHTLSWTGTAQGKIGAGSYGASGTTGTATGGTNLTIEFNTGTLSLVQFEEGSNATTFEQRPFALELLMCQRYYEKSYSYGTAIGNTAVSEAYVGYIKSTYDFYFPCVNFKVEKRAAPTFKFYNTQSGAADSYSEYSTDGTVFVANRAIQVANIGTKSVVVQINGVGVANNSGRFHWTADAEL